MGNDTFYATQERNDALRGTLRDAVAVPYHFVRGIIEVPLASSTAYKKSEDVDRKDGELRRFSSRLHGKSWYAGSAVGAVTTSTAVIVGIMGPLMAPEFREWITQHPLEIGLGAAVVATTQAISAVTERYRTLHAQDAGSTTPDEDV